MVRSKKREGRRGNMTAKLVGMHTTQNDVVSKAFMTATT